MPTLNIQQIFAHLDWYRTNYLSIIKDPSQYYQTIETARIHFGFLSEQKLYLGDLLQLWFGYKWVDGRINVSDQNSQNFWQPVQQLQEENTLYFFSIYSDRLQCKPTALAWSAREQTVVTVTLDHTFSYYLNFIALDRPKHTY